MKKLSMFLLILFVCGAFRSIPLAGAESYADLMYRAEKLTEQRYEKSSRAYRICIAELDAIMTSKESLEVKNAKLKKYIRVLEGAPPIHIAAKKSAPPAVPAAKKPPRNVSETKNNTPAKEAKISARKAAPKLSPGAIREQLHKKADHGDVQAQFALALYYEKQFKVPERIRYLQRAAAGGHPEANFQLALLYQEGNGVPRTYDLAFRHFRKAVQLRCKQAEPYLAWYYLKGKGTLKDETKAFALYEKIYNEGNLKAGIPLGLLHVEGKSIPRDYQKAVRYLETGLRAENQVLPGEFPAYSTLGKIFYEGKHGVTRDLVRARTMLERSSGERNGESYFLLGTMYMRGEGSLAKNEKIAFDCFRKADSLGSIPACIQLGKMYYSGIGTERDPVLAERFLKMAAGYGDLESMKLLAEMLYAKKGSESDDRTALHYFRILAGKGDPAALCRCGEMILNGRGVKKDPALAATYFKRAAEKGHPDGLYFCGMDSWKNGNKKDAFTCLKTAADHGHREATYFAADLLLSGKDSSVPRDLAQGMRYLRLLADAGDRKAQEKFASLCHTGSGRDLKQDLLLAEKYYKLAAAQNSIVSCRSLARIFYGKGDFKQAFFWADKALSLGRDPESSAIIGTMYYKGEGRGKDLGKALQYLLEDAQGGNKDSIDKVGRIYYQTGNLQEAEKYLLKTSSADNADILFMLGRISYLGVRSSGPDYPRAMDLLLAAQEKGSVDAMLLLGRMYHRGEGVHQDFAQARSYFRSAADRGAAEGMYLMGSMYYNGEGISPDYLEAMNWFKKAAEKDHVVAMQYIAIMYKEGIGVARNNQEAARWRKRIRTGRK